MKRREFLRYLGLAALGQAVFPANSALAALYCQPFDNQLLQTCTVGLRNTLNLSMVRSDQHLSLWCWAACIEMVFSYHGFALPQEEIVRQTWGAIVNLPGPIPMLLADLNRPWIDMYGRRFQSRGQWTSRDMVIASHDLAHDMPLILASKTSYEDHAMVLVGLTYTVDAFGRAHGFSSAVVRDPWPGNGFRVLTPDEWYGIYFLARIQVLV
jgi:hypothetical protein